RFPRSAAGDCEDATAPSATPVAARARREARVDPHRGLPVRRQSLPADGRQGIGAAAAFDVLAQLNKTGGCAVAAVDASLDWLGRKLGAWLRQPIPGHEPFISSDPAALRRTLRPADVLLVAGGNRLSTAIKYLTQSTWSHAALYVGSAIV